MGRSGRAAIYEAPNTPFIIKEYPLRPARPREALVRVTMSKDIVDSRFRLSELGTAFRKAAERSVLRAAIVP